MNLHGKNELLKGIEKIADDVYEDLESALKMKKCKLHPSFFDQILPEDADEYLKYQSNPDTVFVMSYVTNMHQRGIHVKLSIAGRRIAYYNIPFEYIIVLDHLE